MANLQLFAKGGLIVLVLVSIAVLIERLTDVRDYWGTEVDEGSELEINSTVSPTVDVSDTNFAEKFSECLTQHSKSEYYPINQTSSVCLQHGVCIYNFLIDLSIIMESVDIHLLLLEPSILFCLLPSARKYNLATRGFKSHKVPHSRNVITFGIYEADVKLLEDAKVRKRIISSGYRILRFQGHSIDSEKAEYGIESSHYFIIRQDMVMHLIVLNSRGSYLWSPGFNASEISFKGLQFVNDRAFENFTTSLVHFDSLSAAQIFLPYDARFFLLDVMTSNFMECQFPPGKVSSIHSKEEMAIVELKRVLASQMVVFWQWSKTLQGWFEKCDILQYSGELKFSVSAKSVYGYNFTSLFSNTECEHVETNLNLNSSIKNVKLNCHEVSIDLIFMYENKISYWYEYLDGHNNYRLKFPKFSLCSSDVFGHKIGVPCETEELLKGEFGQFLKNTTLTLDSESMGNVVFISET